MKIAIKLKANGWLAESFRQNLIKQLNIETPEIEFDFEYDFEDDSDFVICERIWANMNQYKGKVWDAMQPLPESRPHTAMSVGDEIKIDGRAYVCAEFGFEELKNA